MKTFKTPKGTELPIMDLHGKDYIQVVYRVLWFREENPQGKIDTERVSESDKHVTYRAIISILDKESGTYMKLSNADKTLLIKNTTDYEKAETGAIGRALALAGYGTQFAEDFTEGDDLSDAPLSPQPQSQSQASSLVDRGGPAKLADEGNIKFTIGKNAGKTFKEVFELDSQNDFNYGNWVLAQSKKTPDKMHKDQIEYLSYARGKGFGG